jgi:enoyl-CoA hydratase/carnithine racemase
MSTTVKLRIEGPVARVVFSSPTGINLLASDVRATLAEHLTAIENNPQCRVVLISAEGRTFLAGADINELAAVDGATAVRFAREGQALFDRLARCAAVTLAVVNGACAGGGCELALACDLRLAAESARIGLPETSLGIIPGWGGTVRLTRLLGPAAAKAVILSGELLSASDAQRIGLVHRVVPDAELARAAEGWASQLVSRGPEALRRAKKTIDAIAAMSDADAFASEAAEFHACYERGDPTEGLAAFLEKRKPVWSRRD